MGSAARAAVAKVRWWSVSVIGSLLVEMNFDTAGELDFLFQNSWLLRCHYHENPRDFRGVNGFRLYFWNSWDVVVAKLRKRMLDVKAAKYGVPGTWYERPNTQRNTGSYDLHGGDGATAGRPLFMRTAVGRAT
jgi:hypothetical protein